MREGTENRREKPRGFSDREIDEREWDSGQAEQCFSLRSTSFLEVPTHSEDDPDCLNSCLLTKREFNDPRKEWEERGEGLLSRHHKISPVQTKNVETVFHFLSIVDSVGSDRSWRASKIWSLGTGRIYNCAMFSQFTQSLADPFALSSVSSSRSWLSSFRIGTHFLNKHSEVHSYYIISLGVSVTMTSDYELLC